MTVLRRRVASGPTPADGPSLRPLFTVSEVEITSCMITADQVSGRQRRLAGRLGRLCRRHGWARVIVELELMPYSSQGVSCHVPLEVGTTGSALIDTMSRKIMGASPRGAGRVLRRGGPCPVCVRLRVNRVQGRLPVVSYRRALMVNRLTYTQEWLGRVGPALSAFVCPECTGQTDGAAHGGVPCRTHLAQHLGRVGGDAAAVVGRVDAACRPIAGVTHREVLERVPGGEGMPACLLAAGWLYGWEVPAGIVDVRHVGDFPDAGDGGVQGAR